MRILLLVTIALIQCLTKNRQTCDCSDVCKVEFKKIVELKDVGVTIYQYLPQLQDEIQKNIETGEVFILQNTGGHNHKIEELLVDSEQTKITCPRCAKMIQRVKRLFKNLPPINVREVTGVCDHCYQKELLRCTYCEQIVDKFHKFRMQQATLTEEQNRQRNKEWLLETQLLIKKSFSNLKEGKLELYTRSEGQIQQSQITAATNIPITKSVLESTFIPDIDARQRPIVESGIMTTYRPIEEHIGKQLKEERPFKISFSETKGKLESQPKSEERIQDYQVPASRNLTQEPAFVPDLYENHLIISKISDTKLGPRTGDRVQKSKIPISRNISIKNSVSAPVTFLEIPKKQKTERKNEQINARKKYQQPEEEIEKSLRVLSFLDFPDSIGSPEEEVKSKHKKIKGGILKSRDFSVTDDFVIPLVKPKRPCSNTRLYSFETAMKSLSEPNVSDFSYTFPHGKIAVKKQIKGQMSSSELIKNTQDMIQEQIEMKKKKQVELEKLKDEKKKLAQKEKQIKADLKRRKANEKFLEDERLSKYKEAEKAREEENILKYNKTEKVEVEQRPIKYKDFEKSAVFKRKEEKPEKKSKEEKLRKQKETDTESGGKKTKDSEKNIKDTQEQLTTERKIKIKHDSENALKKVEEKEELERKNRERDSEKNIKDTQEQLTTERNIKIKHDSEIALKKVEEKEELERNNREREEKRHELGAKSSLKDQSAKQLKEKSEHDKIKKQHDEEKALSEKKSKESEKALEEQKKQIITEPKRKLPKATSKVDIVKLDDESDKGKEEQPSKDKKKKGTDSEMAAILKEQMAFKKQQELEKEKLRKIQEKERELAEKRLKELEAKKENKEILIKPPILIPEVEVSDRSSSDVIEIIMKPEEVTDMIKGQKIYTVKSSKIVEVQKNTEQRPDLSKSKHHTKQNTAKPEAVLKKSIQHNNKQESEFKTRYSEPSSKPQDQMTKQKAGEPTIKTQLKVSGTTLNTQQNTPETLNSKLKPPGTTINTQLKPPGTTLNTQQKASEATPNKIIENKSKSPMPELSEPNKGIIRYTLSDRSFIEKGWTMLPTEKVVRKMNVYRMRPAKPEFDWFEHNKHKREMTYDSGERLAEFDENGRGRWYYRSGELALDYYDAEETNAGQRFVVYSTVLPDERGRSRPKTVLATFDYSGNGIVFDHAGKIRLKYNQTEGVVLDRTIGPVSHWKWHTLNDPPVLQQVMIDTQMPYKDPTILKMGDKHADLKRPENEEMIAIEFENFLKEKRQKLTQSFKPFQIKMKAMKINEFFSLRVMDQASVYLLYRDGSTNLKINIGMVLDHKEIVDTDTAEIGEVSNTLDKLPACTDSIAGLQEAVARAQATERSRVRHERRIKRPEVTSSVDALHAACSRPLRTPVVQASLSSCDKMTPRRFKPTCCNLYYSTQLY